MTRLLGRIVAGVVALAFLGGCSSSAPPATLAGSGGGGGGATTCGAGTLSCNGMCVANDANNCGACGQTCGAGQVCVNGMCGASCGALRLCGSACVDPMTNPLNCGNCNVVCPSGQCSNGQCVPVGTGTGGGGGMPSGGTTGMPSGGTTGMPSGGTTGMPSGGTTGMPSGGTTGLGGGTGTTGGMTGTTGGTTGTTGGATGTTGGTTGTTGGTSGTTGGTTGSTGDPGGFVRYEDWYGCSWTGIDTVQGSGTTITPKDFLDRSSGDPFCVSGTVGAGEASYEAVALLGFNVQEDPATADCSYNESAASEKGPPGVPPKGTGIAINFAKTENSTLRIQVQGPNGATDENDRWCQTIEEPNGKAFLEYKNFYPSCWETETAKKGAAYSGQPISAVVFLVPGDTKPVPFDFCVNGFTDGNSIDDAPEGGMPAPLLSGTIGGTDAAGTTDPDYKRVKVIGDDGKSYIIQNNNWGQPANSEQTLSYTGNSFTVVKSTGSVSGQGVPASYPSIYIGANGNVNDGLTTSSDDNLPKQVSTITSIPIHYAWTGGGGEYNASMDVWFAASPPAPGSYDDAISGFVMLWFFDPPSYEPIKGSKEGTASLAGQQWKVYSGPRGGSGPNSGAPVVSFVATSTIHTIDLDLLDFIKAAADYGLNQSWYLTDVFGGFEIWQGSSATGVKLDKFNAQVK